jgi:hypothetical protein
MSRQKHPSAEIKNWGAVRFAMARAISGCQAGEMRVQVVVSNAIFPSPNRVSRCPTESVMAA